MAGADIVAVSVYWHSTDGKCPPQGFLSFLLFTVWTECRFSVFFTQVYLEDFYASRIWTTSLVYLWNYPRVVILCLHFLKRIICACFYGPRALGAVTCRSFTHPCTLGRLRYKKQSCIYCFVVAFLSFRYSTLLVHSSCSLWRFFIFYFSSARRLPRRCPTHQSPR
jgi:hypothetical protein